MFKRYKKTTSSSKLSLNFGITLGLVALIYALLAAVMPTHAATPPQSGLAISPPTFELSANPGDILKNSLRVDNVVDTPLEVTVDVRNFSALGEDGDINLTPADNQYALSSWVTVTPAKITVPAHESKTFDYVINIPSNAAPGGHFGSIIFQTAANAAGGQTGVAVSQEIGALVFVKIAGQVNEAASIASFDSTSQLYDYGPASFDIRVKNDGNVQFKPSGSITISNSFGQKVATVPINEQNVLPGAIRKMNASWNSGWLFGRYTATLSLVYGKDRQVITASTAFWAFPYKLISILLIGCGITFAFIYPRRDRLWKACKILFGKE